MNSVTNLFLILNCALSIVLCLSGTRVNKHKSAVFFECYIIVRLTVLIYALIYAIEHRMIYISFLQVFRWATLIEMPSILVTWLTVLQKGEKVQWIPLC